MEALDDLDLKISFGDFLICASRAAMLALLLA
jgi:hypothetical protein